VNGLLVISALTVAVGAVLGAMAAFWVCLVSFALYLATSRPSARGSNGKKWAWGVVVPPFIFMRRGDDQQ
jgi:hypothetical protein